VHTDAQKHKAITAMMIVDIFISGNRPLCPSMMRSL